MRISRSIQIDETPTSASQQITGRVSNFTLQKEIATLRVRFPAFDQQILAHAHRFQIFDVQLSRYRSGSSKPIRLTHHFIEQRSNDTAVNESRCALIIGAKLKTPANSPRIVILLKGKIHSPRIRATTDEAAVRCARR